ncbi:hypothetical protein BJY04DRAFT_146120 [Aspergillus karnatakaensis]|uniref:uncharacterized protein n=1 Tax=Aspergillus karnatakaensis TaxID=1810916 RepID=UPI003CCC9AEB
MDLASRYYGSKAQRQSPNFPSRPPAKPQSQSCNLSMNHLGCLFQTVTNALHKLAGSNPISIFRTPRELRQELRQVDHPVVVTRSSIEPRVYLGKTARVNFQGPRQSRTLMCGCAGDLIGAHGKHLPVSGLVALVYTSSRRPLLNQYIKFCGGALSSSMEQFSWNMDYRLWSHRPISHGGEFVMEILQGEK